MTRALGVDLEAERVRVAVLRAAYRKVALEHLVEEVVSEHAGPEEALKACLDRVGPVDVICTTLRGGETFVQLLNVPASAAKRLADVLPFELEAALPLEIGEVVFDYETLGAPVSGQLPILAVAARKASVSREIARVLRATGQEPERVGAAQLELAQLIRLTPTLSALSEPICIVRLAPESTDICLAVAGEARAGRTLSIGVAEFPEAAERLAAQLRQTLASFEAHVGPSTERLVLVGEGAVVEGMCEFLSARLPVSVEVLPALGLEGLDALDVTKVPSFALALATAAHGLRRSGFDLRQGELSFERGYGFVKDKLPLLSVLGVLLVLSFLFATWAQGRALEAEKASLEASLELLTLDTFGKKIADPEEAEAELDRLRKAKPEDPMPYLDGFGVTVAIAETLPTEIVHDIEQFEYSKGKLNMRGIVSTTDEAQRVAKALDEHRCIEGSNVSKISQVVNSDRARYVMEAKVACPEDQVEGDKKPKKAGAGE
jgi:general secretion pathway protein L